MSDWYYDLASPEHFWVRRRFNVLRRLADPLIRRAARIAEIGCGSGVLQRGVEDHYGIAVAGFELNEHALQKNVSRMSPLYCYDIHRRAPEFREHFDLLLLFDVLEHIDDEVAFLQSLNYHLAGSGTIAINVPAHQFLYSEYDRAAGHFRRYSIRSLTEVVERSGLRIRSFSYWGSPLVPLLMARKAIVRMKRTEEKAYSVGFNAGGRMSNRALSALARCEPLPQKLLGTSLMALLESRA